MDDLVSWLETTDFFLAPASTRPGYHGCHKGGLVRHCLNVYDSFEEKSGQYDLGITPPERTIASLCHDLCKIGIYRPNLLRSGRLSSSRPYVVDDHFPYGHGEKSVLLVSRHVGLTEAEALLIRWHMGPFDPAWDVWGERVAKVCPAIYAFHNADQESSRYLDYSCEN
jgi:hypothetical protein